MRIGAVLSFMLALPVISQEAPPPFPDSVKLHEAIVSATQSPDSITLYLIKREKDIPFRGDSYGFHGYTVLAQKSTTEVARYSVLLSALRNGFSPVNFATDCSFFPHHGIRLSKGKAQLDLVIGYSCGLIMGHESGKTYGPFYITNTSEAELNKAFVSFGLPLPGPGYW